MYQGQRIGVVVPAYNEEYLVESTIKGIPDLVDRIYIVDDASIDTTPQVIGRFNGSRCCPIFHPTNRGVGAAIVTGYKKAIEEKIDIVVVMAGDNQMDPQELSRLLTPLTKGKADYTKGNRLSKLGHRRGMSNWRYFGNQTLSILTRVASGYWRIGDPQNGYAAITCNALRRIDLDALYPRYGYCNDMLIKLKVAGCKVVDIPMASRYGEEKSKIRYGNYVSTVSPLLLRGFLWRIKR